MSRGGVLIAALLVTLASPVTWPLALGAFLVRGGILLVALPIVVLPTPVGLGTAIAPALSSVAFGTIPPELVVVTAAMTVGTLAWLVAGGWLAAALEAEGARIVAADEDVAAATEAAGAGRSANEPATRPEPARIAARILVARLIACLPLGVVLALGSVRLIFVTYRELTDPVDVATPIVLRVLRSAPEVVVAVVLAWMLAEIVGAIAARRIVLTGVGVGPALKAAASRSFRQPASVLVRFWLPTIVLVVVLAPGALAAASAWEAVRSVLGGSSDPVRILVTVVAFVALWIVGLVLIGVACAWRAAVWTVAEVTREGTFGGSADRRPGHWRRDRSSATL
ncbi:MAG: hypothetical protein ABJC39_01795 [Chloroflexota bacterium]